MAVIINNNYQAIDFSDFVVLGPYLPGRTLDDQYTPIFDAEQSARDAGIPIGSSGTYAGWNYTAAGSSLTSTTNFRVTDINYSRSDGSTIHYQGNLISSGGTYSSVSYKLPYVVSTVDYGFVEATYTGTIGRGTNGIVVGGTVTHISIVVANKTVEIDGQLTLDVNGEISGGYVTAFKFVDESGNQLNVTNIKANNLSFEVFDDLTFNQFATTFDPANIRPDLVALFTSETLTAGDDVLGEVPSGGTPSSGGDTLIGGAGNDTYVIDNVNDVIIELAGGGTDTVKSRVSAFTLGDNLENLILETSAISGTGNTLNNVITGNADNNILDGGTGTDTLIGGLGNDSYAIDITVTGGKKLVLLDKLVEAKNAGSDTLIYRSDTIALAKPLALKLTTNFESLDVSQTGSTSFNLTGDKLSNALTGNAANNVIDGGAGADTMTGGAGNDTYIFDNVSDSANESAGSGNDLVIIKTKVSGTYTLTDGIESVTLSNSKAFTVIGNDLDNTLIGNSTTNTLIGGLGNDTLNGGKGNDTLVGGVGDDIYIVDRAGDIVTEGVSEGLDTIFSSASFTLSANIENIVLTGKSKISATGNELDNSITGNAGTNTLNGAAGNDTINGAAGTDILIGGAGNDNLTGGLGADTFKWGLADVGTAGSPSNDTITDFTLAQKDKLDLRDLLVGENKGDINSLLNFLDITTDGTSTEIRISSTGGFSGGTYSAGAEDAHISLNGNLLGASTEDQLLQSLISSKTLIID